MSKIILQKHHIIYESKQNKEVTRKVRKGVHLICSWIRRYKYLTDEEISTIRVELELKRRFGNEK